MKITRTFRLIFLTIIYSIIQFGCPTQPTDNKTGGGSVEKPPKRDYFWSIDTMIYNAPEPPPDQISINSIWGSSPKDVWAVAQSEVGAGRLWHYNGVKWEPRLDRPRNGFDGGRGFIVYPYAVIGFDSQNVFLACDRFYEGYSDSAMVLKWNGSHWSEVPWEFGSRAIGGLGELVQQGKIKFWGTTAAGVVVNYNNGILKIEPKFIEGKINDLYVTAALDNGEVYLNFLRDSIANQNRLGSITKLYLKKSNLGFDLLESKFISGADYDDNGLGRGIWCIGNKIFTDNKGVWVKNLNGWRKELSMPGIGGTCLITENNIWTYFRQDLWHYNGKDWKQITIPQLQTYPGSFLYGSGWSDNNEIFLSLQYNGKTLIVHGK